MAEQSLEATQWCARHWQPYRERLGNGLLASVLLIQKLTADERFARACGYDPATGQKGAAARMNAEMEKLQPLCCFLGDQVMGEIFAEARRKPDA